VVNVFFFKKKKHKSNLHRLIFMKNVVVGHYHEATRLDALKEALAEFISTLTIIIVFANEGFDMAFAKVTDSAANTPTGLITAAIAHAFALFVVGATISKKQRCLAAVNKLLENSYYFFLLINKLLSDSTSK
jgi:aquaporin TIP